MSLFHRLALTVLIASAGTGIAGPAWAQSSEPATRLCGGYPAPTFPDLTPIAAAAGTATVTSPFGDVDLPVAPGAALGMYTTDVDMLIWLGFPLAAMQPIRGDSGYAALPCFFPQQPLEGVAVFGNYPEYNFEQILVADPDFILNGLGYDSDVVERLPQIAPTYSVDAFDGRPWGEHFEETAAALSRTDRYQLWRSTYEARLAEVREEIAANSDAVVAPFSYWGGTYSSGCYVGVQCTVFRDLSLTIFEGALSNAGEGLEFSPEELGRLDGIDYVFTSSGTGEEGLAAHAQMLADAAAGSPLWSGLSFVENGHIIPFEMEMVYGSPSGQLAFLEVVAATLGE